MTNLFIIAAIPNIWSIGLIILAILLLFGGKKIPELMRGLGQGMKEFKNATKDKEKEDEIESTKDDKSSDK